MFKLNEEFSVNVVTIDEEHKKLIDIVNKAVVEIQHSKDPKEVLRTLDVVTVYAVIHFETEESYMRQFNFPEYQFHRNEHICFVRKAVDYKNRIAEDDCLIRDEVIKYLRKWTICHILETDKKYTEYFNGNGLK
ncbi:MAG: bacteriohemerythrin [Candidatus Scalindua sp.]